MEVAEGADMTEPERETAGQQLSGGEHVGLSKGLNSEGMRGFVLSGEIEMPIDLPVGQGPIVSNPSMSAEPLPPAEPAE
jgi:hypothetical protein